MQFNQAGQTREVKRALWQFVPVVILEVLDVFWDSGSSWQLQQTKNCAAWYSQRQNSALGEVRWGNGEDLQDLSPQKRKAVTCSHSLQWEWGAVNHDWGDNWLVARIFKGPPYTQGRRPPRNLNNSAAAAATWQWMGSVLVYLKDAFFYCCCLKGFHL